MDDLHDEKEFKLEDMYDNEKLELDVLQQDYADRAEILKTTYEPRFTTAEQTIIDNHQSTTAQLDQTAWYINLKEINSINILCCCSWSVYYYIVELI